MRLLSTGTYRGLQQCATRRGALAVLALDHRNNLRQALNPDRPDRVSNEQMSAFKGEVVRALAPYASAALLDPEVGAFHCIASGALPGNVGLVVALEATGYTGDPAARESRILDGWSVTRVKRMGASAVKLLVYYHPDTAAAEHTEHLVSEIAAACEASDIPFMLEPLSYSPGPARQKLVGQERRRVVIETARRLTALGGDVLKAEFPLDIQQETDEQAWADACAELTDASRVPWVLLSASVDYDTYLRQVVVACQQGASGVAAGRAIWKEAAQCAGPERQDFLSRIAADRLQRITAVVDVLAVPWTEYFAPPAAAATSYLSYPEGPNG